MQLQVCLRLLFQQIFHGKSSNSWRVGSCSNTLSSSNESEFIGLHHCVVRIFTHHLTIRIKDRNIGIHIYMQIYINYMDPMENSRNYTFSVSNQPESLSFKTKVLSGLWHSRLANRPQNFHRSWQVLISVPCPLLGVKNYVWKKNMRVTHLKSLKTHKKCVEFIYFTKQRH